MCVSVTLRKSKRKRQCETEIDRGKDLERDRLERQIKKERDRETGVEVRKRGVLKRENTRMKSKVGREKRGIA